jgi:hypothetical protein
MFNWMVHARHHELRPLPAGNIPILNWGEHVHTLCSWRGVECRRGRLVVHVHGVRRRHVLGHWFRLVLELRPGGLPGEQRRFKLCRVPCGFFLGNRRSSHLDDVHKLRSWRV